MWSVLGLVLVISAISWVLAKPATIARADDESNQPLDCISCHKEALEFHDALGTGNESCLSCHDSTDMSSLRLSNGTHLSLADSSQLCGQCHQKRYDAWEKGTHGIPGTIAAVKCADCHDPHQPQIALLNITRPHPAAAPPPPSPPFDLMMIVAISLVFLVGLGLVLARQKEWS